jgi:two-component system chemotaxis response regulator CheB
MNKIRILIVDDSLVFRHAVEDALKNEPDMHIAGSVRNGVKALEFLKDNQVDIVTLDIEMPDIDGLQTLDQIIEINKENDIHSIGVLMLSGLNSSGVNATIDALERGAFDFVKKPVCSNEKECIDKLHRELVPRIRQFMKTDKTGKQHSAIALAGVAAVRAATVSTSLHERCSYKGIAKAIIIGVSTGGPKALSEMLPLLCSKTTLPILIVQHMPPVFTASLADSLSKKCMHSVKEAQDGEQILPRHVYIAPGGKHMLVSYNSKGNESISINDLPPENGCRPSVDILFRSAATIYGGDCISVILTGMGTDGTHGLRPLNRCGAWVIVQDETTSVVWGMPGSALENGLVDEVVPLMGIPDAIAKAAKH